METRHTSTPTASATAAGTAVEQVRIYADESGTHGDSAWLVIGMLFVPDHHVLHPTLCAVKDELGYLNTSPKLSSHYKETHFADFRSPRDARLGREWIDRFLVSQAVFRAIVVDWSLFQGKYFGDAFEDQALKKRRAYKKWAELLLQPEVYRLRDAAFYLDRLGVLKGYDVLSHLRERFTLNEFGEAWRNPRISTFQAADSWKDANQCLQLCDLLVGCISQGLTPGNNAAKRETSSYLYERLKPYGVKDSAPGYWRGYSQAIMSRHFPKFSEWFWRPK